jgi:BolA protein
MINNLPIAEQIQQHLHPVLQAHQSSPIELVVEDESFRHGRVNSHFKVVAVADCFAGLTLIQRHRMLYQQLDPWLKAGVHALALHLFTPQEWSKVENTASPLCRGGE